ncbi:hypothetical protein [Xanthomonas graminis]|nr:hypothetical protein [Xanthomonas translucens]
MKKTATSASKRAGSLKFNLTYDQVLALSLTKAPAWDAHGKV